MKTVATVRFGIKYRVKSFFGVTAFVSVITTIAMIIIAVEESKPVSLDESSGEYAFVSIR